MKTLLSLSCLLAVALTFGQPPSLVTVRRSEKLLGVNVEVTVIAEDEEIGYINIEEALAEIRMVEKRISTADPRSEASLINARAGLAPVPVSRETFNLLQRAVQISELTYGAFDITVGALDSLWRFDGSLTRAPSREALDAVLPRVGYRQLQLDPANLTAFLPVAGMKIDLMGIGRGYAADRAKEVMLARQVPGGMISVGGDLTVWGSKATGEKWLLGISDPVQVGHIRAWIPLIESSVSMVRPENRYLRFNGVTYGEVLDPASGMPVQNIEQVTVLARSAELSQALATALCVLGPDRGIRLVELLGDTEAIVVTTAGTMAWSSGLMLKNP